MSVDLQTNHRRPPSYRWLVPCALGWLSTAALCVRGGRYADVFVAPRHPFTVASMAGGLVLASGADPAMQPQDWGYVASDCRQWEWHEWNQFEAGFTGDRRGVYLQIPWCFIWAIGLALHVRGELRRRNVFTDPAADLCRRCGYDLRATPERCPECGDIRVARD